MQYTLTVKLDGKPLGKKKNDNFSQLESCVDKQPTNYWVCLSILYLNPLILTTWENSFCEKKYVASNFQ